MASEPAAFWWQDLSGFRQNPPVSAPPPKGRNVFFRGIIGQLYQRFTSEDENTFQPWDWLAHGLPPNGALMASAPTAVSWNEQDGTPRADVFFSDDTGALVQAHWEPQPGWSWNTNHGQRHRWSHCGEASWPRAKARCDC
jgi:hypothetical protein